MAANEIGGFPIRETTSDKTTTRIEFGTLDQFKVRLPCELISGDEMTDDIGIFPGVSAPRKCDVISCIQRRLFCVEYTHPYIGFRLGGIPLIYHSTISGVHILHRDTFDKTRERYSEWRVGLPREKFAEFCEVAALELGRPYSRTQVVFMAIAHILRIDVWRGWIIKHNREKAHVCSETAGRMLWRFAPSGVERGNPDTYSPMDFYRECLTLERKGIAFPTIRRRKRIDD